MTPPRLAKYFDKVEDDKFAVKQDIKNCIEFKRHNLLKDPFEKGFDLILCRNVVISTLRKKRKTSCMRISSKR